MKFQFKPYVGDWWIIILLKILFALGLIVLYSATSACDLSYSPFFIKQSTGLLAGIFLAYILSTFDYLLLHAWGQTAHYMILCILGFTLFKGSTAMGAKRWINLGFIKFQPSELAKITLPLFIGSYLAFKASSNPTMREWLFLCFIILITFLLILKQPDLGSAIIVGTSGFILLYIAGLPKKIILGGFALAICIAPLCWKKLHEYQKKRILVFLGQGSSKKERYQLEQSQIAVGSGGLYGKGFLKGSQKNLKFLPENRTDFIFAVLCEEYGFIGVVIIITIYALLIMRLFAQCSKINGIHAYILSCGLILPFALSVVCNCAMVIGLLPIVGIPLPCMSYGVTNLWITLLSLSLMNNILSTQK